MGRTTRIAAAVNKKRVHSNSPPPWTCFDTWIFGPLIGYTAAMPSYDYISIAQAEGLREQLAPMSRYLQRLVVRLEQELRVEPADMLLQDSIWASNALRDLCSTVHYLPCRSGVGERRG